MDTFFALAFFQHKKNKTSSKVGNFRTPALLKYSNTTKNDDNFSNVEVFSRNFLIKNLKKYISQYCKDVSLT